MSMKDMSTTGTDSYLTLEGLSHASLKVLGSKFLAFALPVASREEALEAWKRYKREFHDATHHCLAYRLIGSPGESRYNDDGEPAGSAGKPILSAIDHAGLKDVAVVVVRYFGGTKLGMGGLGRAYGDASAGAIAQGNITRRFISEFLSVAFPHHLTSPVMRTITEQGAVIVKTSYDESVHLRLEIRQSRVQSFITALVDATKGGIRMEAEPRNPETPPGTSIVEEEQH